MDSDSQNKLKGAEMRKYLGESNLNETNMSNYVYAQTIDPSADFAIGGLSIGGNSLANGLAGTFTSILDDSSDLFNAGPMYGTATISTAKNTIDIDELADLMETIKKRLLILTPNFEKQKKYPMLKQMYDEYKAMEKLLEGPELLDEQ